MVLPSMDHMKPRHPLPHSEDFASTDQYVDSLLAFVGTNDTLRTLCGGVHILDFFTSSPSLYSKVVPEEWRDFFTGHQVMDIIDLMIRDDLSEIYAIPSSDENQTRWKNGRVPPSSFTDYVKNVRKHLLRREPDGSQCSRNRVVKPVHKLARHTSVGMTIKKVHEVGLFASYIDRLTSFIAVLNGHQITHLIDFGSGQNYLGRALASEPYHRNIVAIESKQANAERAKELDVMAKLATKEKIFRNKKAFRTGVYNRQTDKGTMSMPGAPTKLSSRQEAYSTAATDSPLEVIPRPRSPSEEISKMCYIEHHLQDGNLEEVIDQIPDPTIKKNLVVVSLHSCGNLVHHGLRSLILNPDVRAVAMVGCCYNLITERLGPATYKLPELRPTTCDHPRLEKTGEACDPHGFPMSSRLCNFYVPSGSSGDSRGVRLNITARMMAVQAPSNWGQRDSESFFTRHFYRALLQRIFLDRGIVDRPAADAEGNQSPAGHSSGGTPIIIGSLRKACYDNFTAYVRGALTKLVKDPTRGELFMNRMCDITDEDIQKYEIDYQERKKDLSIIWSLMAFSAGVIEATIVVDRWLWLEEQKTVKHAWVEPVFDYRISPRNLVVVGIKQ